MTTGNIKFSQLPDLPLANITSAAIAPAVENSTNYKVSFANIASFVNNGGNITATTVSATGNITGNYILGNGSQLTGLPATYGNANVATYLASGNVTSNVITTGNIQGANIITDGNIYFGTDAPLEAITADNLSMNFVTNGQTRLTITSGGGTLQGNLALSNSIGQGIVNAHGANITGNIDATGNITGNYYIGNGSLLTGVVATLPANITGTSVSVTGNVTGAFFVGNGSALTGIAGTYSNANVESYLASGTNTSNIITTGNVTGTVFIGSGAALTNLPAANIVGTVANATYAANAGYATTAASATTATTATSATTATTAVTAGTVTSASQPAITSLGTLSSLSVSGNINAGNYRTTGSISATGAVTAYGLIAKDGGITSNSLVSAVGTVFGNGVVSSAAIYTTGTANITAAGNVSGTYIKGNGSPLTGIVTSVTAGTGISVSASTGNITITNTSASGTNRIAQSFTTGAALGNVETISKSVLIAANTFSGNDVVRIVGQWEQGNSAVAFQGYMNIYINTANSIPSSTQNILFTFTPSSAGPTFFRTQTFVDVIATTGNTRVSAGGGGGSVLNYTSATGYGGSGISPKPTYMSIDWTQPQYIIFTTYSSNNSYNFYCTGYQIYKE